VGEKLQRDRYSSASEYVRELIRQDLERDARERVDELLNKGFSSVIPTPGAHASPTPPRRPHGRFASDWDLLPIDD